MFPVSLSLSSAVKTHPANTLQTDFHNNDTRAQRNFKQKDTFELTFGAGKRKSDGSEEGQFQGRASDAKLVKPAPTLELRDLLKLEDLHGIFAKWLGINPNPLKIYYSPAGNPHSYSDEISALIRQEDKVKTKLLENGSGSMYTYKPYLSETDARKGFEETVKEISEASEDEVKSHHKPDDNHFTYTSLLDFRPDKALLTEELFHPEGTPYVLSHTKVEPQP